jgi:hypothetical protein
MKLLAAVPAAALSAGLVGCGSSHSTPPRASESTTAHRAASPASPSAVAAGGGGGDFCADTRALGLEQRISLNDGSARVDASLLPRLDALAAEAPTEISSDFALFVKIEHALLGGGAPDPAVLQQIDSPDTESRLGRVGSYLDEHCGTGAS